MLEEEPSVSEILSSIRQVLSREAEALNNGTQSLPLEDDDFEDVAMTPVLPTQKTSPTMTDDFIVELTPQMRLNSDSLLSNETALKAQASLEKLNRIKVPEIPFEQLEKDLRPLLREWLNRNLPDIVEKIVTQEVRRLINGK